MARTLEIEIPDPHSLMLDELAAATENTEDSDIETQLGFALQRIIEQSYRRMQQDQP